MCCVVWGACCHVPCCKQVLLAAQQALDVLMLEMPPLRCADIMALKLPSEAATSTGTAVDGEALCATIRCLQVCSWGGACCSVHHTPVCAADLWGLSTLICCTFECGVLRVKDLAQAGTWHASRCS